MSYAILVKAIPATDTKPFRLKFEVDSRKPITKSTGLMETRDAITHYAAEIFTERFQYSGPTKPEQIKIYDVPGGWVATVKD